MVEVDGEPLAVARARAAGRRLASSEAAQLRARLRARQARVREGLRELGAIVPSEYQNAYNGLAVQVPPSELTRLRQLPGVVGVHPIRARQRSNVHAAAYVGAPLAWSLNGSGFRGETVKIAIIDGGIDYTHANFGGPGTPAAYQLARASDTRAADPALFGPDAPRVKGGIDLVGNAYDADSDDPASATPVPDANPLDCDGHGSHVAGSAGGSGVTVDGRSYDGPYGPDTHAQAFRVGPGVAPRAELYAVRVFGCSGSTEVTVDAIEWALDHQMDVINLSLGSPFGSMNDADAVAASNAVRAGVVGVAAAGNSGPGLYIVDTPAIADGVLSVAAMDASTPTIPGEQLTLGARTVDAQNSTGAAPLAEGVTYPIVVLGAPGEISLGCDRAEYDRPDVRGAVVVTRRGQCDRVARAKFGQEVAAAAVVLVNGSDETGFPPFEGEIQGVSIPFLGVRSADAAVFGAATTLQARPTTFPNTGYLLRAPFSSGGPRIGDSALKPNLIAPGMAIVSTEVATGASGSTRSRATPGSHGPSSCAISARKRSPST